MSAADVCRARVGKVERPCPGCGRPTAIWIDGIQGHYGCLLRKRLITETGAPIDVDGLRLLEDLHSKFKPPGAFWRPPAAPVTDLVNKSLWSWRRLTYCGPACVLDRNAAWVAGASSVEVARDRLEETGSTRLYIGPGYYKVPVLPEWSHPFLPHPLGGATPAAGDDAVWVPHPRARLLWWLARRDLWPEFEVVNSWTCPTAVRLDKWAGHIRDTRTAVIDQFGYDSEQYGTLKDEIGQSMTAMLGERNPGQGRTWKTPVHRPDWYHAIESVTATTLYQWAVELHEVATDAGRPELSLVGMRAIDELIIPAEALDLFTTRKRRGNLRPLRIDQTGIALGTFKIKGEEMWADE